MICLRFRPNIAFYGNVPDSIKMKILGTCATLLLTGCATSGDYNGGPIDSALRSHKMEYRWCYEHEVHKSDDVGSGKVVLEWTIEETGQPSDVQVFSSTLKNIQVEQCLINETKKIQFPNQEKSLKIKYPFAFTKNP